jgi:hypothetical protein
MIELDIEHSQVPSVQPRHEAPSRLRPPQRSRVAGAKKDQYNTKYNTNMYNTKYTPPSGVFSFPGFLYTFCSHLCFSKEAQKANANKKQKINKNNKAHDTRHTIQKVIMYITHRRGIHKTTRLRAAGHDHTSPIKLITLSSRHEKTLATKLSQPRRSKQDARPPHACAAHAGPQAQRPHRPQTRRLTTDT